MRAEGFEARAALCLGPVDLACRVLELRSTSEELRDILRDEARSEAGRRLRPNEPEATRSARERLRERASFLARRRSLCLALWRAAAIRREILGDGLEDADRDAPDHETGGIAP